MGGTSTSTQQTTSQASPYAAAQPGLSGALSGLNSQVQNAGLTANESGAINTLEANAGAGNPYAGLIGNAATGLLNGGGANSNNAAMTQSLSDYRTRLSPYADGSMVNGNAALKDQLAGIANDVTNQVNSQFAAAGRDGSAANVQALGRGIAQGEAPVIASQYNQDVANQLNAAGSLYGAGNTTYGLLNQNQQSANQNQQAGSSLASQALDANNWGANQMLGAEQQKFNIPTGNYTTLLGAISPVAQAFGTSTGTQTGSNTMSGAQQFGTIMSGIGALGNLGKFLGK